MDAANAGDAGAQQAIRLRDLFLPASLLAIVDSDLFDIPGAKCYVQEMMKTFGDPKDPIEFRMYGQFLLSNIRLMSLQALAATAAKELDMVRFTALNTAAVKSGAEQRQLFLALQKCRNSATSHANNVQNVVGTGGKQEVTHVDQLTPQGGNAATKSTVKPAAGRKAKRVSVPPRSPVRKGKVDIGKESQSRGGRSGKRFETAAVGTV